MCKDERTHRYVSPPKHHATRVSCCTTYPTCPRPVNKFPAVPTPSSPILSIHSVSCMLLPCHLQASFLLVQWPTNSLVHLLRPGPWSPNPLPLNLPLRGEPDICVPSRGHKSDDDCVACEPHTVSPRSMVTYRGKETTYLRQTCPLPQRGQTRPERRRQTGERRRRTGWRCPRGTSAQWCRLRR